MSEAQLISAIKTNILNPLIILLFTVALVVFLWGIVQYMSNGGSPDAQKKGAQHVLWGVVGMGIMLSAYGIMGFIIQTIQPIQPSGYTPPTTYLPNGN
jgi:Type IV secretion system pilin